MTKEELAFLSVSCPLCKATKGHYCTLPRGGPYYRRTTHGEKKRAFHERRKQRAFALYKIHATALEASHLENRQLAHHPQVQSAKTLDSGCKVIRVDFAKPRKEAPDG